MTFTTIYYPQPKCITCGKLMTSWNPWADIHEHVECASDRISDKLITIIKQQLNIT